MPRLRRIEFPEDWIVMSSAGGPLLERWRHLAGRPLVGVPSVVIPSMAVDSHPSASVNEIG